MSVASGGGAGVVIDSAVVLGFNLDLEDLEAMVYFDVMRVCVGVS